MKRFRSIVTHTAAAVVMACTALAHAATVELYFFESAPDPGFYDPTPAPASAANPGTTIGEQRRNAIVAAADVWAQSLQSTIPIRIVALWSPQQCDQFGGVLASARSFYWVNGREVGGIPDVLYPAALANKLGRRLVDPNAPEIVAFFNSDIGKPVCGAETWNLSTEPSFVPGTFSLFNVTLHELAHGLGFAPWINKTTGEWLDGYPDVFSTQLIDESQNWFFSLLSPAERATSIKNVGRVGFLGSRTQSASRRVLNRGTVDLFAITDTAGVGPLFEVGELGFGPAVTTQPIAGAAKYMGLGCAPYTGFAWYHRIAVVDRGDCTFFEKIMNAQNAGAQAILIVNNDPGFDFIANAGLTPIAGVSIPTLIISKREGDPIKQTVARSEGPITIQRSTQRRQGTTPFGRPMIFTPSALLGGSSLSHFDVRASPNLLMEPGISSTLNGKVAPPDDLTLPALRDLGW